MNLIVESHFGRHTIIVKTNFIITILIVVVIVQIIIIPIVRIILLVLFGIWDIFLVVISGLWVFSELSHQKVIRVSIAGVMKKTACRNKCSRDMLAQTVLSLHWGRIRQLSS